MTSRVENFYGDQSKIQLARENEHLRVENERLGKENTILHRRIADVQEQNQRNWAQSHVTAIRKNVAVLLEVFPNSYRDDDIERLPVLAKETIERLRNRVAELRVEVERLKAAMREIMDLEMPGVDFEFMRKHGIDPEAL